MWIGAYTTRRRSSSRSIRHWLGYAIQPSFNKIMNLSLKLLNLLRKQERMLQRNRSYNGLKYSNILWRSEEHNIEIENIYYGWIRFVAILNFKSNYEGSNNQYRIWGKNGYVICSSKEQQVYVAAPGRSEWVTVVGSRYKTVEVVVSQSHERRVAENILQKRRDMLRDNHFCLKGRTIVTTEENSTINWKYVRM